MGAGGCSTVCVVNKVHVWVQVGVALCVWSIRCMYVCRLVWHCVCG